MLAFILIAVSLAWFTIDKALDLDSFGMKSVDSPFELKTVGSANMLKAEILDSNDYSKVSDGSNITSDENNKIYWLLDEERYQPRQSWKAYFLCYSEAVGGNGDTVQVEYHGVCRE